MLDNTFNKKDIQRLKALAFDARESYRYHVEEAQKNKEDLEDLEALIEKLEYQDE